MYFKPDAVNPAMALWSTINAHWRRVTDLKRWKKEIVSRKDPKTQRGIVFPGFHWRLAETGLRFRQASDDYCAGDGLFIWIFYSSVLKSFRVFGSLREVQENFQQIERANLDTSVISLLI